MQKKVVELFAGVGGFRVGLNKIKKINKKTGKAIEKKDRFDFVWANQWEPSTKSQEAYECYMKRFSKTKNKSENISNDDISSVDKTKIPDHALLCGGFPCQDYSVAHSLASEKGIEGKKGVLWWQINEILKTKETPFVLLENVDRLIKSPAKQRGRDFGIMLRCLNDLGYNVEWRVINAADYGHPQRRRRIYIFAYLNTTKYYERVKETSPQDIMEKEGVFAKKFPIENISESSILSIDLKQGYDDLVALSDNFKAKFENCGFMKDGIVYTTKITPICSTPIVLRKIIDLNAGNNYDLSDAQIAKFKYLRDSKKVPRKKPDGTEYFYSEGAMSEIDSLDLPGRTMLTSEGTVNRSTHIIKDPQTGNIRLLTPIECERLQQFPDNWTDTMSDRRRRFMMGNALVCGIIEKLGDVIFDIIDKE